MPVLFRKMKEIEAEIDEFLDVVVRGGLVFKQGVKFYLGGHMDEFEIRCTDLDELESKADALRRSIQSRLYIDTLIPESRGDVLGILEASDRVLNITAETLKQFSVETPNLIDETKDLFLDLTEASVSSVESMVLAIRAYFRDLNAVRDHINKSSFYEKEADKIGEKITRKVFRDESLRLSEKFHMRYFILHIEQISDSAEDVCDRLAIAAIKRDM